MNGLRQLLKEPLVRFFLIGGLLFGVYGVTEGSRSVAASAKEIHLSVDELSQLVLVYQSQWRRAPTPEEFERLVESKVQQEILYREAHTMGLDKNDEIVKRRMAQKMRFLAEDASAQEPDRAQLVSWYEKNSTLFAEPSRFSFRHLYFSPDRRGAAAREGAVKALAEIGEEPQNSKRGASLADQFMFQEYYRDRAPDFIGKELGPGFAQALAKLVPQTWQGPIESGFGWHLVFVDTVVPGRIPTLDEVEPEVKKAWLEEQKALAWDKTYREMRASYTVLLPAPSDGIAASGGRISPTAPKSSVEPPK
jgi:peptidyl-prolyl cis-trans isomerase C